MTEESGRLALPRAFFEPYRRFTCYDSPYRAHDRGCAVDLFPGTLRDGRTTAAPSPVSGTVLETRTVRAPPKPYASAHDHLVLIACTGPAPLAGLVARILHVEPSVAAGDRVVVGDSLGRLVRAGFFAPWVDNHLHVGFRKPTQNHYRASGSLPLEPAIPARPLAWDGSGTVVATGECHAVLDAPTHPSPGEWFGGIGVTGRTSDGTVVRGVLDGGLPHYDRGGIHLSESVAALETVSLAGHRIGSLAADGRTIHWDRCLVRANGVPITGLAAGCARDVGFGVTLVCPDHEFAIGEEVRISIEHVDDPGG